VMAAAGTLGCAAGVLALGLAWLPEDQGAPWLYGIVFLLVGIAEAGLRLGRKTYLLDGAPAAERPLYTAFANSMVGVLAFGGGLLGLLADFTAPAAALYVLTALAALGALASWRLPEARRMVA